MILVLLACGEADDSGACDRDPPLGYENFGSGFLRKYCTGCHSSLLAGDERGGAPEGSDFDTYAGVLTWAADIEARSVPDDATMPPGGGPTSEERALLAEWLDCRVAP